MDAAWVTASQDVDANVVDAFTAAKFVEVALVDVEKFAKSPWNVDEADDTRSPTVVVGAREI